MMKISFYHSKKMMLLLTAMLTITLHCQAIIKLPDVLSDNMVLQRNQPVPVWGYANPGEAVSVSFGGQSISTTTDEKGNWKVVLDPLKTNSNPSTMLITGENRITLTNILVGEVWLCSGQSNMQWTLQQSAGGEEAISKADQPMIRLFNVNRSVAFKKKEGKLATWKTCSPQTVADFSGVGYFFGLELLQTLNVPIGLVNSSYGGSQAEAWTPVEYLADSEDLRPCIEREMIWKAERPQVQASYDKDIEIWKEATEKAKNAGLPSPRRPRVPDALRDYRIAGSIYNNMIAPLIPFSIKGALWYQGESNEERAEQYELLLPVMIRSWRESWGQGNFPFMIVQLPNFRQPSTEPEDKAWSHLRDAQRKTANSTPNTGLIVTLDIGEADDIHPTNKFDVGKRLSQFVLAEVYEQKMTSAGPVFKKAKVRKNRIVLFFENVGSGLQFCTGTELNEFTIAGEDHKWQWAKAKIKGKNKVVVWSDKVSNPKAVRYAFNNNPISPNLTNETCIPASPFRTDNWPGPTKGKR